MLLHHPHHTGKELLQLDEVLFRIAAADRVKHRPQNGHQPPSTIRNVLRGETQRSGLVSSGLGGASNQRLQLSQQSLNLFCVALGAQFLEVEQGVLGRGAGPLQPEHPIGRVLLGLRLVKEGQFPQRRGLTNRHIARPSQLGGCQEMVLGLIQVAPLAMEDAQDIVGLQHLGLQTAGLGLLQALLRQVECFRPSALAGQALGLRETQQDQALLICTLQMRLDRLQVDIHLGVAFLFGCQSGQGQVRREDAEGVVLPGAEFQGAAEGLLRPFQFALAHVQIAQIAQGRGALEEKAVLPLDADRPLVPMGGCRPVAHGPVQHAQIGAGHADAPGIPLPFIHAQAALHIGNCFVEVALLPGHPAQGVVETGQGEGVSSLCGLHLLDGCAGQLGGLL